jgi:hypothetical protein
MKHYTQKCRPTAAGASHEHGDRRMHALDAQPPLHQVGERLHRLGEAVPGPKSATTGGARPSSTKLNQSPQN